VIPIVIVARDPSEPVMGELGDLLVVLGEAFLAGVASRWPELEQRFGRGQATS
jgi:hypothetical protein